MSPKGESEAITSLSEMKALRPMTLTLIYYPSGGWHSTWSWWNSSPLSIKASACEGEPSLTRYWPPPRSWITVILAVVSSFSMQLLTSARVAVTGSLKVIAFAFWSAILTSRLVETRFPNSSALEL